MERLNPQKLSVEFRPGVTETNPVIGRKYTLTHSDITAELFLTIGLSYAYDQISSMRDEVLAEWTIYNNSFILYGYVYVDDPNGTNLEAVRNFIFQRELPLALEAIRYGDSNFFVEHPELNHAPIWIQFDSSNPNYNRIEYWGTPKDYE